MKKLRLLVFVLLFTWILPACQGDPSDYMPDIDLPLSKMNRDLHLILDPTFDPEGMDGSVELIAYNSSDLRIVCGSDYGVHVYRMDGDQWGINYNRADYGIGNQWVYENGSEYGYRNYVFVIPGIDSPDPTLYRIIMLCNYVETNGELGKETGAYVDVTIDLE